MNNIDNEIDITKLKYVLYARKSSTDESRQVRSIKDQIADCKERIIKPLNLNVVAILQESKSAKTPHIRPVFDQIISDIRKGKYDGIVAWNPDRLARNMLEGGEIIDMIDTNVIQDLKFVTHHFTKDANGKMLLGMAFVLSKQYSDDLSQKVSRGVGRNLDEGKSGTPKYGYIRSKEGFYIPDENNFELICEAWQMKKDGYTYEDITKEMNERGFYRLVKSNGKKQKITKQKLSKMFSDPFYYGILVQNEQVVDLRMIYDFAPAVAEQDYFTIQKMTNKRPTYKEGKIFYPFRKMIQCSFCDNIMYVAPSTGSQQYLYARCDNKPCARIKKSIRVKVILDFIYTFLEDGLNFSEKGYENYSKKMKGITQEKQLALKTMLHNKQGILKQTNNEINERSLKIGRLPETSPIYKANERKVLELQNEADQLQDSIDKIKEQLGKPESDEMTIDEFLNFSKEAVTRIKAANPITKDRICRKIFLNWTVDEEKVLSYQLKEPFATLLKTRSISSGRDGGT